MKLLVAYASAHGSTRGIAERLAARLGENGYRAEPRPVDQIHDLGGFDAVVIGSAVHNQAWLPGAVEFVRRNREALAHLPVWLFSVGSRDALHGVLGRWFAAHYQDPKEIAGIQESIHPRGHRIFTGVINRDLYPFLARLLFRSMGGRYGDFRNGNAIDAWADAIAGELAARNQVDARD